MVKKKEDKGARPMSTTDGREQQLIALAINLAEKQLRDGTASPSVINHYLKMGSAREVMEREILERQAKLIDAKAQNIVKEKEQEVAAKAALEAMKKYSGSGSGPY